MPAPPPRRRIGRYTAPAAFLVAVTIAVLLIRSGLGGHTKSPPRATVTHPAATTVLKPPPTSTGVAAKQSYTVQTGDTFGAIAAKEGTTIAELERLNPGVSPNALQVGQKIRVK